MLKTWRVTALLGSLALGPTGAALAQEPSGTLRLTFDADGNVSLSARNVTVRDVLREWARQCGCYVVNADRLPGGPLAIPVEFTRESQSKVLESLLRQAAGYVLTPRRPGMTGASYYETIYILPTSTTTSVPSSTYGPYAPPVAVPIVSPRSPDDELPPISPGARPEAPPNQTPIPPAAPRPTVPGVAAPAVIVPIGPATQPPAANPNSRTGIPDPGRN